MIGGIVHVYLNPPLTSLSLLSSFLSPERQFKCRESNEKALAEISTKTEEAIVNAGDTEVLDLMFNKAAHHTKVGAWDLAFDAYDEIIKKEKISSGKKLDAVMAKCRIALFNMDLNNCKTLLAEAKRLNDLSGDWDHRNRLKVYEAMYLLTVRDFKASSVLLQSCIATFTCTEICDYNQFMFYALLTNVMNLPRIELQKKIVNDPQVISVIRELPNMQTFVNSIYQCEYKPFVETLVAIAPRIQRDRYLGPHTVYVLRECRILAYSQFLEAYRSVLLQSMADNFGMSLELLDKELSHFISAGRLNAKIDKVGMVVETSRPDKKNAQYLDVIKKGDALLNQVQKLARVVEL